MGARLDTRKELRPIVDAHLAITYDNLPYLRHSKHPARKSSLSH